MRRIGTSQDGSAARRFCDYLLTLDIDATTDANDVPAGSDWDIWIRNEEDVEQARAEWAEFQRAPEAARYQVDKQLAKIRDKRVTEHRARVAPHRNEDEATPGVGRLGSKALGHRTRGWSRPKQDNIPVTIAIIAISVIASFTSHFGQPRGDRDPSKITLEQRTYFGLSFVDRRDYAIDGDPFGSIKKGQLWRFITPMFLHGDEFHLLFNMLWIFFLGSSIERLHGSIFLVVMVLVTQTAGMMLQVMLPDGPMIPETLRGSPFAIGASGAVYGLFGYLWIRPRVEPGYPIHLVPMNVVLMLGWLVLCLSPIGENVANGAHLGGLFAGILMAVAGPMLRR